MIAMFGQEVVLIKDFRPTKWTVKRGKVLLGNFQSWNDILLKVYNVTVHM